MNLTKEQEKINRSNQRKARKYFGLKKGDGLTMHHINPDWRHNDIERYIQWNPEDLIVMTKEEHTALHNKQRDPWNKGKKGVQHHSEEYKQMLSERMKGNTNVLGKHWTLSEEAKNKHREARVGMKFSDEWRQNISNAAKKRPKGQWFNNGEVEKLATECPDGFVKGRLKRGTKAKS